MSIRPPLLNSVAIGTFLLLSLPVQAKDHQDNRIMMELQPHQRAFVLNHMKSMLETIGAIQLDLAEGKPELVAERVQALKQKEHKTKPKGLGKSFSPGFRAMSKQMNLHWQVLMQPIQDEKKILQQLHHVLVQCNACHQSFQLKR